jgi:hypothetical protein
MTLRNEDAILLVSKLSGGVDPAYDAAFIRNFCDAFNLDPVEVWIQIKPLVILSRVYVHPTAPGLN